MKTLDDVQVVDFILLALVLMAISNRVAVPLAAAVLLALSGGLHAYQTNAWSRGAVLADAASRLERIPLRIASWVGEERELDARQMKVAQAAGALSRTYVSEEDGTALNVLLICGPSGPIAVHPPTICFTAAGYEQVAKERRVIVSDSHQQRIGSFWVADFEWHNENGASQRIRTYWGWSNDGQWKAPDYPRYEFAGSQVLHKLYVTRQIFDDQASDSLENEPIESFLRQLLPLSNRALFRLDSGRDHHTRI